VQHVIYTSWPEPQHSVAAVSPDHAGTEELILNSGLKFTFLGNYSYSELLMFSLPKALEGGTLYGAAGTGRAAYVTRQDQAQLEAKFQAIVKPLLAEQHAHMVAVTTGPQTLTEAVEWYQQFASRFVGTLGGGPETEALAQEFRKRRNAQLVAALPEIRLRVQGAKSAEAVGAVLSQCCSLAEDNQVPGVSAVHNLAAQRSTALAEQDAAEERRRDKSKALNGNISRGTEKLGRLQEKARQRDKRRAMTHLLPTEARALARFTTPCRQSWTLSTKAVGTFAISARALTGTASRIRNWHCSVYKRWEFRPSVQGTSLPMSRG
jgi:hypothetical protein